MDGLAIANVVRTLEQAAMADYAAQRYEIIAEQSEQALYTLKINNLVASVGKLLIVRAAVKEGFSRRVQRQVLKDVKWKTSGANLTQLSQM